MTTGSLSLRRNFSWTFLGNVVFAACLWGVLAVLTKLGSPDIVGRFALGSAIATPVFMFFNLQLRNVLVTAQDDDLSFGDYFGARLLMLPLAAAIVLVIAFLGYNVDQVLVIAVFIGLRLVESLIDLFYGFSQKQERMDIVAVSLMIRGVVGLVVFGLVFFWTSDLVMSLAAWAGSWTLVFLLYDVPCSLRLKRLTGESTLRPRWRIPALRKIVWTSLPLGMVLLLINLRHTIPRTFLESSYGEAELGIFSALSYLVIAGSTVILALSQSSVARLAKYFAEGRRDLLTATIGKILMVGAAVGVGGILVAAVGGGPLLTLLYSSEYGQHNDLFVLIMVVGAITYIGSLLGAPAMAMRFFQNMLWVYLANVVLLTLLAWLLIPRYGMTGAALAMLGGSICVVLGNGFLILRGIAGMEKEKPGESGTRPLRVLHVVAGLGRGGAETSLLRTVSHADRDQFSHTVVSLGSGGELAPAIRDAGAELVELEVSPGARAFLSLPRLARVIRDARPDIVQTWMYYSDLLGGIAARMAGNPPVVWGLHHADLDPAFNKRSILKVAKTCARLSRWMPRSIVCCSESTRRVHADFGYDSEKMVVIPNGYEVEDFRPDPAGRQAVRLELGLEEVHQVVGMVGRFHPLKDHRNFLAAARLLLDAESNARFVLCGPGVDDANADLMAMVDEFGLREVTLLLGQRDDPQRIMNSFDVGTISSAGEAFPNVVCEMMLCGLPCVVTDVGDASLIVGPTGLVVPRADAQALAGRWREILELDPEERRARGLSGRQRIIDNYSAAAISARYHGHWAGT